MSSSNSDGAFLDERDETDTGPYDEDLFRPAIRIVRDVITDRDFLYEQVAKDYVGQTFTAQLGEAFAADAEKALGWVTGAKAIRATIQYHVGEVMTERLLLRICWQLSANEELLKKGLYLSPRLEDYSGRWMIVDVSGIDLEPRNAHATLIIRALAGRAAGWSMRQDITDAQAYFIASQLGFQGGWRREWYQFDGDVSKLYGLYFAAYLEENRVSRFACTDPLWTLNRRIIRMRHRGAIDEDGVATDNWGNSIDPAQLPYGCPIGLTHECLDCPRKRHIVTKATGYEPTADTCGAAY